MFILDMPNVPPQDVPVIIAQAEQAQQSTTSKERKMGVCKPIANLPGVAPHLGNLISPIVQAGIYSYLYEHQEIDRSAYATATASVLQNPKHGVMRLVTEADRGTLFSRSSGPLDPAAPAAYVYLPEQGYLGNDSATFLVDIGGKKIKVVYYFKVVDHPVGNDGDMEICKTGPYWKISTNLSPNGASTITSVEYQRTSGAGLALRHFDNVIANKERLD